MGIPILGGLIGIVTGAVNGVAGRSCVSRQDRSCSGG
jgi:hypothetical protein